jgi:hypothetical protein
MFIRFGTNTIQAIYIRRKTTVSKRLPVCVTWIRAAVGNQYNISTAVQNSNSPRMPPCYTLCLVILNLVVTVLAHRAYKYTFPKDFLFSAATSAYQVEGAWNVDGEWNINITVSICNCDYGFKTS